MGTQCLLLCATNAAALQLVKRPHQQPRVILTTEQVEKLERSVAAALPAVGQWAAFGGVVAGFTGFLWGWAGVPAAALYASSVASGTAWALAWDHVMPGGGRRVACGGRLPRGRARGRGGDRGRHRRRFTSFSSDF